MKSLKPLSVLKSIPYFAISSLLIYVGLYYAIPFFQAKGLSFLSGYLIFFYFPFFFLFITALLLYHLEGNKWNVQEFKSRMRLNKFTRKDWVWTIGLLLFGLLTYVGLAPVNKWLAEIPLLSPPDFFPAEINPNKTAVPGFMMGYKLSGQYWVIAAYFSGWFFNIFGEELLWRGIILPRQIVRYGSKAWIYHGILWGFWHFFWKWNLISIIPFALALSYVAYKRENTWIPILTHGIMNFVPLIMIIIEVFN